MIYFGYNISVIKCEIIEKYSKISYNYKEYFRGNMSDFNKLYQNIDYLNNILFKIIKNKFGEKYINLIKSLYHLSIDYQKNNNLYPKIENFISELTESELEIIIKIFTIQFELLNVSENTHRIRRKIYYENLDTEKIQKNSFGDIFTKLYDKNNKDKLKNLIKNINIDLVMTAHPTEPKRKVIMKKLIFLSKLLIQRERYSLLKREREEVEKNIYATVELIFETEFIRTFKLTPKDELKSLLLFFEEVFIDLIPELYQDIKSNYRKVTNETLEIKENIVNFASWVGGDMDGNPFVDDKTIIDSARTYKITILNVYAKIFSDLQDKLSWRITIDELPDNLKKELKKLEILYPKTYESRKSHRPNEAIRLFMAMLERRVIHNIESLENNFEINNYELLNSKDYLLTLLRELKDFLHDKYASFYIENFIDIVKTFGVHLVNLDIREDSLAVSNIVSGLVKTYLNINDYIDLPESKKEEILTKLIHNYEKIPKNTIGENEKIIKTLKAVSEVKKYISTEMIGNFILSMSSEPSNILELLLLFKIYNLGNAKIMIVPLFETITDLKNASSVMDKLLNTNIYKEYLNSINKPQMIMLGYSDSSKDGSVFTSRIELYKSQQELINTFKKHNTPFIFFHGRGGSIGRGGGPTFNAITSQVASSFKNGIRITQQGEVIFHNYHDIYIAKRNIEQIASAMLFQLDKNNEISNEDLKIMENISLISENKYRELIYGHKDFYDYMNSVTPISYISKLNIGSRPVARRSMSGLKDIRAIPWFFSWVQNRGLLVTWYGTGTALSSAIDLYGIEKIKNLYNENIVFKSILDNFEITIAKVKPDIFKKYLNLSKDKEKYKLIIDEFEITQKTILEITKQNYPLEINNPVLKKSIDLRNPFVDILSFIQIELLKRDKNNKLNNKSLITATILGIAHAMRNTG